MLIRVNIEGTDIAWFFFTKCHTLGSRILELYFVCYKLLFSAVWILCARYVFLCFFSVNVYALLCTLKISMLNSNKKNNAKALKCIQSFYWTIFLSRYLISHIYMSQMYDITLSSSLADLIWQNPLFVKQSYITTGLSMKMTKCKNGSLNVSVK